MKKLLQVRNRGRKSPDETVRESCKLAVPVVEAVETVFLTVAALLKLQRRLP